LGIFGGVWDFWQPWGFLAVGASKGEIPLHCVQRNFPSGVFGGVQRIFPTLANLVGMTEIEQSTKKVGIDIL
jgi:hypothetical protein